MFASIIHEYIFIFVKGLENVIFSTINEISTDIILVIDSVFEIIKVVLTRGNELIKGFVNEEHIKEIPFIFRVPFFYIFFDFIVNFIQMGSRY